jgi:hypothetical protein
MGAGSGAVSPGQSATGGKGGQVGAVVAGGGLGRLGGSGRGGLLEQATSVPTIAAPTTHQESRFMVLILLEALAALLLLVGIVWWTMFSGRDKGELPQADQAQDPHDPPKS